MCARSAGQGKTLERTLALSAPVLAQNDRFDDLNDLLRGHLHVLLQQLGAELGIALAARLHKPHMFFVRLRAYRHLDHLKSEIPVATVVQHPQHLQRDFTLRRQIERFVETPVQMPPLGFVGPVHFLDHAFGPADFSLGDAGNRFRENPRFEPQPDVEGLAHLCDG